MKIIFLRCLKFIFTILFNNSKTVDKIFEDSLAFFENNIALEYSEYLMLKKLSKRLKQKKYLLIDVGVNYGQFIDGYSSLLFDNTNKIIGFEPQREAFQYAKAKYSQNKSIDIYNYGIGIINEVKTLKQYKHDGLSSFLKLTLEGENDYSSKNMNIELENEYEINVITLDSFFKENPSDDKIILKIDTQGFEFNVLKGAENLFKSNIIDFVIIEIVFTDKYEEAPKYFEIFQLLNMYGFNVLDLKGHFYSNNGDLTEGNAIFINNNFKD